MQDFIKQIEALCHHNDKVNNSFKIQNTIQQAMKENHDGALVGLMFDEPKNDSSGALNINFYAYSQEYVYFLEVNTVEWSDGEQETYIVSVPRNPNPKACLHCFEDSPT